MRNPGLSRGDLLALHRGMVHNRAVEEKLSALYRQGKIVGGLYSSLGQEAISVGTAAALRPDDLLAPMIRNLGALLVRGVTPRDLFLQFMARYDGPTHGKDGTLHFGNLEKRALISPISHLGTLIPVMAGAALAARQRGEDRVALTYIGDGGTSTGDFHEGFNLAAVLRLPLILV
ncbi:MAG: thiamine pyrophosphate-dependent dehydrogenase E1 component subunit alpha, partial [Candidatus Polarisedimenticolia bacterium]